MVYLTHGHRKPIYFAAAFSLFFGQCYNFQQSAVHKRGPEAHVGPLNPPNQAHRDDRVDWGSTISPESTIPIIVAGLTAQGAGMLVSMLMLSNYCLRMIQYGLPSPQSRTAMLIAMDPPAFTSLPRVGLTNAWPADRDFADSEATAAQVFRILATFSTMFIWSLGL